MDANARECLFGGNCRLSEWDWVRRKTGGDNQRSFPQINADEDGRRFTQIEWKTNKAALD
jgi:hypothetical protein